MRDKIQFDSNMKDFFETISVETDDIDICREKIKKGLLIIGSRLRMGKAVIEYSAPKSKLIDEDEHKRDIIFECDDVNDSPIVFDFVSPNGAHLIVYDYPLGAEPYTAEEKELHGFIMREIYFQFSRTVMKELLTKVMDTDLGTGVSSLDSLMRYAGKCIRSGTLQDYNAFFFNIHNFKYVNKIFAYAEGDAVIREYAQKVKSMLLPDEMIARLGGDNFVIICRKERTKELCKELQNIKLSFSNGVREKEFLFGATIGLADLDGVTEPREIMSRTSVAYSVARRKSAGSVVEFSHEIQRKVMEDQVVVSTFFQSLMDGEFIVYYQPKVHVRDKSLCGAEALVRWVKAGTIISPMSFIPQLEQDGSICMLDYYVLEETCKFLKRRTDAHKQVVPISVNFSRRHLEEPDIVDRVVSIVDKYGVDHSYIEIELTESDDFQNYEIMSNIINGLKDHGIRTAIDDFGTGFSSLNMIKKVDLSVIKIDRSFIPLEKDYSGKEKDMIMFDSIVKLINQLGKSIVAEGVETKQQLNYLSTVGCDVVQGYVFDKPLCEKKFEERLEVGYIEA